MVEKLCGDCDGVKAQTACSCEEDAFWEVVRSVWSRQDAALEGYGEVGRSSLRRIIAGSLVTEGNMVFSPTSILCSLLALSQLCGGGTKKELLDGIGCDEREASTLYEVIRGSVLSDAGLVHSSICGSLWIDERIAVSRDGIKERCGMLEVDAYRGGANELEAVKGQWLQTRTGALGLGMRSSQWASGPRMLEFLAVTCFRSDWKTRFWRPQSYLGSFRREDGTEVQCRFMSSVERTECWAGGRSVAVCKKLKQDYEMWFVLPKDGLKLEDIIRDDALIDFLVDMEQQELVSYKVTLHVPKFDIRSMLDMRSMMEGLGIRSVFHQADMTPISDEGEIYLSKAVQTAQIQVMEDGVEAVAGMEYMLACGAIERELPPLELKLDRPFLFTITKARKMPLFVGAVTDPVGAYGAREGAMRTISV